MKKTLETTFINGERVAYNTQVGFNVMHVSFYFPHRVCVKRTFEVEAPESFCKNTWTNDYRYYTAVRFTVDTSGFNFPMNVVSYCKSTIHEKQWMPIAGHHNFWAELDKWFKQQGIA